MALEVNANHLGALRRKASLLTTIPGDELVALEAAHKAYRLATEYDEMKLITRSYSYN